MTDQKKHSRVDLVIVTASNLFNLLMVGVFFLRTRNVNHPLVVGVVWAVLILGLAAGSLINLRAKRNWWFSALPLLFAVFLAAELILDYFLQFDFRATWLLAPYLILYYLSILGMIGYSFLVKKAWGAATLATYFLSQIAAIYSYIQVGHG